MIKIGKLKWLDVDAEGPNVQKMDNFRVLVIDGVPSKYDLPSEKVSFKGFLNICKTSYKNCFWFMGV